MTEWRQGDYLISTDRARVDLDVVHGFLVKNYWSPGIPLEVMKRSIEGSLPFSVWLDRAGEAQQVGFARVISDQATFAYIGDVFVVEAHRGRGLSKWLMQVITGHPQLQGLRRWCLLTRDAHGLYAKSGFKPLAAPDRWMERWTPDVYQAGQGR